MKVFKIFQNVSWYKKNPLTYCQLDSFGFMQNIKVWEGSLQDPTAWFMGEDYVNFEWECMHTLIKNYWYSLTCTHLPFKSEVCEVFVNPEEFSGRSIIMQDFTYIYESFMNEVQRLLWFCQVGYPNLPDSPGTTLPSTISILKLELGLGLDENIFLWYWVSLLWGF